MNFFRLLSAIVLQLVLASIGFAQPTVSQTPALTQKPALTQDVGGLVVAQTMTLAGRTFYDSFASAWHEKDPDGRFSVSITERPTARLGSQVWVDYGNRRLLQMFLPPNRSLIPAIGASAAEQVYQAILEYQVAQFFGDPDIGRDEL